jgi:hypothetical protein
MPGKGHKEKEMLERRPFARLKPGSLFWTEVAFAGRRACGFYDGGI